MLWKAKHSVFKTSRLHFFLFRHDEYVNPVYIIKNKHILLIAVEKSFALFVETDPIVNIHEAEKNRFLFLAQYLEAKKLIIVPIESFHTLQMKLEIPKFQLE